MTVSNPNRDDLIRLVNLGERAVRLGVSIYAQIDIWERVLNCAVELGDEHHFDRADRVLGILKGRLERQ